MKNAENNHVSAAKDAGYLLGGVLALLLGIAVWLISGNVTLAISATVPVSVTLGILFEQRLQHKAVPPAPGVRKAIWGLLALGVAVFIVLLILYKLI
ncbi:MAG: hypothetical protein EP344_05240 [Bacteroidetes bacterium]|nr:MAG: hypothetical protein EP344_05240 [Bacteroidota bacterium]